MKNNMNINYFQFLQQQIEKLQSMSEGIEQLLVPSNSKSRITKQSNQSNQSNQSKKEIEAIFLDIRMDREKITERLMKEFLPPIDREDIYILSNRLYEYGYDLIILWEVLKGPLSMVSKQEIYKLYIRLVHHLSLLKCIMSELENFKKSKTLMSKIQEFRYDIFHMEKEIVAFMLSMTKFSRDSGENNLLLSVIKNIDSLKKNLNLLINEIELAIIKNS